MVSFQVWSHIQILEYTEKGWKMNGTLAGFPPFYMLQIFPLGCGCKFWLVQCWTGFVVISLETYPSLLWLAGSKVDMVFNLWRLWALSIQPKIPKISKRGQMVRKISEKVCRQFGNCWISKIRIIEPKMPGESQMIRRFPTSQGCAFFLKFRSMLFHWQSSVKISRNSNHNSSSHRYLPFCLFLSPIISYKN